MPIHVVARSLLALPLLVLCLQASACSATRNVRPVGEGRMAAGTSVGGPLFSNLGAAFPVPLVSGFVRYGLDDRTDLDAGLHAPIAGAMGLDFGAGRLLLEQNGGVPAVMVGGRLHLWWNALALTGRENPNTGNGYAFSPRLYEELYATASWKPTDRVLLWSGLNAFAQLEKLTVLPSLVAGAEWRPVPAFGIALEGRHLAFTRNTSSEVVAYTGLGGYGAFGLQLAFTIYPGAAR